MSGASRPLFHFGLYRPKFHAPLWFGAVRLRLSWRYHYSILARRSFSAVSAAFWWKHLSLFNTKIMTASLSINHWKISVLIMICSASRQQNPPYIYWRFRDFVNEISLNLSRKKFINVSSLRRRTKESYDLYSSPLWNISAKGCIKGFSVL